MAGWAQHPGPALGLPCENIDTDQIILAGDGRVARPFGFALTDPGMRLSRTRLLPEVTRVKLLVVSMGA